MLPLAECFVTGKKNFMFAPGWSSMPNHSAWASPLVILLLKDVLNADANLETCSRWTFGNRCPGAWCIHLECIASLQWKVSCRWEGICQKEVFVCRVFCCSVFKCVSTLHAPIWVFALPCVEVCLLKWNEAKYWSRLWLSYSYKLYFSLSSPLFLHTISAIGHVEGNKNKTLCVCVCICKTAAWISTSEIPNPPWPSLLSFGSLFTLIASNELTAFSSYQDKAANRLMTWQGIHVEAKTFHTLILFCSLMTIALSGSVDRN